MAKLEIEKRTNLSAFWQLVVNFFKNKHTIEAVCAFLCSLSPPMLGTSPFGAAFFAASFSDKFSYINIPIALLGAFIGGAKPITLGKYLFAMAAFSLIIEKLPPKAQKSSIWRSTILASCLFVSGVFFLVCTSGIYKGILIYDCLVLVLESIIALALTASFYTTLTHLLDYNIRHSVSGDDLVALVVTVCVILRGMSKFPNIWQFNIANILSILFVMIFSNCYGAAAGSCIGIIMGVLAGLGAGRIDTSATAYSFCGLMSGYFGKFGKVSSVTSFILANSLITIFTNGSTEVLINIFDIFLAGAIFLLLPKKTVGYICGFATQNPEKKVSVKTKEYISNILKKRANTVYSVLSFGEEVNDDEQKRKLITRTVRIACAGCALKKHCWEKEQLTTLARIEKMLSDCQKFGKADPKNAPTYCLRPQKLAEAFSGMHRIYCIDMEWLSRLKEKSTAQLKTVKAINSVLEKTAETIERDLIYDVPMSESLFIKLKKGGIIPESVAVLRDKNELREIEVKVRSCGGFSGCDQAILPILKQECKRDLKRIGSKRCNDEFCTLIFTPVPHYRAITSVAGKPKERENQSGDFYGARSISKNHYAIALCDAMGSGETAYKHSKNAIETLFSLLESGFSPEETISVLNATLISNDYEVNTVALDLCVIDLLDGTAKIYKSGGASAFLKTKNETFEFFEPTLSEGSTPDADIKCFDLKLQQNDMLIFVSDGVVERNGKLKDFIKDSNQIRPANMSESIINYVKDSSCDDLTAIAVLMERA